MTSDNAHRDQGGASIFPAHFPIESGALFCGRWATLFDHSAPPFLGLRLVTLPLLQQELNDPSVTGFHRKQLEKEYSLLKEDVDRLDLSRVNVVSWAELGRWPEHSALKIAYALLCYGHHPTYLRSLFSDWIKLFTFLQSADYADVPCRLARHFSPAGFSLDSWRAHHQVRPMHTYFIMIGRKNVPARQIGVKLWTPDGIPSRIRIVMQGASEQGVADSPYMLIEDSTSAPDPSVAVATCLERLAALSGIAGFAAPHRRQYFDIQKQCLNFVIVDDGDDLVPLRWRPLHTMPAQRLEVEGSVDRTTFERIRYLTEKSRSFAAVFDAYSGCLEIVRRHSDARKLLLASDSNDMLLRLTSGLDSLFGPALTLLYSRLYKHPREYEYQPGHMAEIGARILALDTFRRIRADVLRAARRYVLDGSMDRQDEAFMRVLVTKDMKAVAQRAVGDGFKMAAMLTKADALDHYWNDCRPEFVRQCATRYYYDLLRCVRCRNSFMHRGDERANYYLLGVLLGLFRLVISMRISATDVEEVEDRVYVTCNEDPDEMFAHMVQFMTHDFDVMVNQDGKPIGLGSGSEEELVRGGWAGWVSGIRLRNGGPGFDDAVARCAHRFKGVTKFHEFGKAAGLML